MNSNSDNLESVKNKKSISLINDIGVHNEEFSLTIFQIEMVKKLASSLDVSIYELYNYINDYKYSFELLSDKFKFEKHSKVCLFFMMLANVSIFISYFVAYLFKTNDIVIAVTTMINDISLIVFLSTSIVELLSIINYRFLDKKLKKFSLSQRFIRIYILLFGLNTLIFLLFFYMLFLG